VGVCEKKQLLLEPVSESSSVPRRVMIRVPKEVHREFASRGSLPATFHETPSRVSVFSAVVEERLCRGCGLCEEVCEYKAVQVVYRGSGVFCALVNEDMCRGCGVCTSICPTGAMDQHYFARQRILGFGRMRSENIVTYRCMWAESPAVLIERGQNSTVEVMCIGSVAPGAVLKTFERGAWGVLLLGCGRQSCHYGFGREQAEENMRTVRGILSLLGTDQQRVRIIEAPGHTGYEASLREIEEMGPIPWEDRR
jgi:heterodisulfide reductase subunit A